MKDDKIVKVVDKKCDPKKKEESSRNCTGTGVCQGDWFAGPWSEVSVTIYCSLQYWRLVYFISGYGIVIFSFLISILRLSLQSPKFM